MDVLLSAGEQTKIDRWLTLNYAQRIGMRLRCILAEPPVLVLIYSVRNCIGKFHMFLLYYFISFSALKIKSKKHRRQKSCCFDRTTNQSVEREVREMDVGTSNGRVCYVLMHWEKVIWFITFYFMCEYISMTSIRNAEISKEPYLGYRRRRHNQARLLYKRRGRMLTNTAKNIHCIDWIPGKNHLYTFHRNQ